MAAAVSPRRAARRRNRHRFRTMRSRTEFACLVPASGEDGGENNRRTRFVRGSFQELEAVFVLAESRPSMGDLMTRHHSVTYRIVLQWLGLRLPSMILEQDYLAVPHQAPLGAGAAITLATAERYGRALGVPVVNHTHVSITKPV